MVRCRTVRGSPGSGAGVTERGGDGTEDGVSSPRKAGNDHRSSRASLFVARTSCVLGFARPHPYRALWSVAVVYRVHIHRNI